MHALHPYAEREIHFRELWDSEGVKLKVYTISHEASSVAMDLLEGAKCVAAEELRERPTRHSHYGVGFLGIHDGRGENQVFLDMWINENELLHRCWVSPKNAPGELVKPPYDFNSVCCWDLFVQCFERAAWIKHVLRRAENPDLEGYLADVFNGVA